MSSLLPDNVILIILIILIIRFFLSAVNAIISPPPLYLFPPRSHRSTSLLTLTFFPPSPSLSPSSPLPDYI